MDIQDSIKDRMAKREPPNHGDCEPKFSAPFTRIRNNHKRRTLPSLHHVLTQVQGLHIFFRQYLVQINRKAYIISRRKPGALVKKIKTMYLKCLPSKKIWRYWRTHRNQCNKQNSLNKNCLTYYGKYNKFTGNYEKFCFPIIWVRLV